jgi:hypothetical protein
MCDGVEKSFSYNDYIVGDIKIKYIWLLLKNTNICYKIYVYCDVR